jgi:DNA-binding NarL/FixJ family response regulator
MILIVDDELDFAEAFRRTLGARELDVVTASNKAEAQDLMKHEPNLIVLGTLAPAGQAFALHQWLKQHPRHKDIPLMVIDARQEDRLHKGWRKFEGMQLESDEYVSKPIEPSTLVPRIQALLDEAARMIRVLVVDDHTMIRDGIGAVLALHKDIDVVGEAINGQDALDKVMRLMPSVALIDIAMPVMSGLEATKRISKDYPDTKVLILTQYDEAENMMVAKQNGAYGFIPKKAAGTDLVAGIKAVYKGKYFPDDFAQTGTS